MRDTTNELAQLQLDHIPTLPELSLRIEQAIEQGCISPCDCYKCQRAEFEAEPLPDEELPVIEI